MLPIYIWLTGILLFASFAFFVFAQAASARGGAQSAADAAALAAAQSARDELLDGLVAAIGGDEDWREWLTGERLEGGGAEDAARQLASANDAHVSGYASVTVHGYPGFRVEIQTNDALGESIIPGTESLRAQAEATAVVKPRCVLDSDVDFESVVEIDCDGDVLEIDPVDFQLDDLPDASVLFSVHLVE